MLDWNEKKWNYSAYHKLWCAWYLRIEISFQNIDTKIFSGNGESICNVVKRNKYTHVTHWATHRTKKNLYRHNYGRCCNWHWQRKFRESWTERSEDNLELLYELLKLKTVIRILFNCKLAKKCNTTFQMPKPSIKNFYFFRHSELFTKEGLLFIEHWK